MRGWHLRGLSELKAIGFQETRITDAGVAGIASLADLRLDRRERQSTHRCRNAILGPVQNGQCD